MKPQEPHLAHIIRQANPKQVAWIMDGLAHYTRAFLDSKGHQPEGVAAGMHDLVDEQVAELERDDPATAARVACKPGCAHCCYVEVTVTRNEAALLVHAAQERGLKLDRQRLKRQAGASRFMNLPHEARRCVFLSLDNQCRVYAHRPNACRKYLVVDTAENCDTVNRPGAKVGNFVSVNAEITHAAAMEVFKGGRLAAELLKVLPR